MHKLYIYSSMTSYILHYNKNNKYKNGIKHIKNYDKDFFVIELKTNEKFFLRKKILNSDIHTILEIFIGNSYNNCNIISGIRDKIVIDVGANIGDTAVFFAERGAIVYAYEPSQNFIKLPLKTCY